jgi:hypothetical protein
LVGRRYRWKGEVWVVVCRWAGKGPRNVLLEREGDGFRLVRPFRGLRRA